MAILNEMMQHIIGLKNWLLLNKIKYVNITIQIGFLKRCKRNRMIPRCLRVANKLQNTFPSEQAISLTEKHSRQWLTLAIDSLYQRRENVLGLSCGPLNEMDSEILKQMKISLQIKINRKFEALRRNADNLPTQDVKVKSLSNLSSVPLTNEETNLLMKGPSYAPTPFPIGPNKQTILKARIDVTMDKVAFENPVMKDEVNEARGALHRILKESISSNDPVPHEHRILKALKAKEVSILPTDKSKRLCVMDKDAYTALLRSNHDGYSESKFLKPQTSQSKFNSQLSKLWVKYSSATKNILKSLTCSEPLPSVLYCLPKDHKPGDLKGRPIVAALDTPSTKLSVWMANVLNGLLVHVPAHIKSSSHFKDLLCDLRVPHDYKMASLDVTNLYGSIPLEGNDNIISVASGFFEDHKAETLVPDLDGADFETLLRMCLTSDTISIDRTAHRQTKGLAMGNNAAPPLAIIYMNFIEKQILEKTDDIFFWRRYLDDIFLIYKNLDVSELLVLANSVNASIQFTIETALNDQLPFLDILVQQENNGFQTSLHMKPSHSGHILPWSSHHPMKVKENVAFGEFLRAKKLSSNIQLKQGSISMVTKKLRQNGYPEHIIIKMRKRAENHAQRPPEVKRKKPCLILPYINETNTRKCLAALRRAHLQDELRIIFQSRTLSSLLADKRKPSLCAASCVTCLSSNIPQQCYTKNVVYSIKCRFCSVEYIGETGRTIRSRIIEHCSRSSSAVFQHLTSHGDPKIASIEWTIVHRGLSNFSQRLRVESFEIQSRHPYLNTLLSS